MCHGWAFYRFLLGFLFLPVVALATRDLSPGLVQGSVELEKTALSISYNPSHKQADWVFYSLGSTQLRNCSQRTENFLPDPALNFSESAQLSDYKGSGFDRGHLSPAADNKWSNTAMDDSFLLSNISPQPPSFNRGIWAKLEGLVRGWAVQTGGILVTTGPVLETGLNEIGSSHVSVPKYFYKVLVTQASGAARKGIALLLPVDAKADLANYVVSIRDLERRTGLNFDQGMDRAEEDRIESGISLKDWDFSAKAKSFPCNSSSPMEDIANLFINPNQVGH